MEKITKFLAIPTAILGLVTAGFAIQTNYTVIDIQVKQNKRDSLSFERDRDFKFKMFDYVCNAMGKDEQNRNATIMLIENMVEDYKFRTDLNGVLSTSIKNPTVKKEVMKTMSAIDLEIKAFSFLLDKNLDSAKINFEKSYNNFPTLHSVDEINKILKKYNKSNLKNNENWMALYKKIYPRYQWGMSSNVKNEFINKISSSRFKTSKFIS